MTLHPSSEPLSRPCALVAGALVAAVVALRLWISAHEWFIADDFYFLYLVQTPAWSWAEALMPSMARMIGVYRPLGLEGYFAAGLGAFGLSAFGYYVLGLLAQLATAALGFRIARQLGVSVGAAIITAVLVICAAPGLTGTYAVNVHNYLLAGLCYALSVSLSLDALDRRRFADTGACVALTLGVLCNEICASLPLVVLVAAACRQPTLRSLESVRRCVLAALPTAVVVGLFVDFRMSSIALRQEGWFYEIDLGGDMVWNTFGNLALISGGAGRLAVVGLLLGAFVVWLTKHKALASSLAARRVPLVVAGAWLAIGVLPFSVLAFPHERFALFVLAPFALLIGALLDVALAHVARPSRALVGALLVIAIAVPWREGVARGLHPEGAAHRQSFATLRALLDAHPSQPTTGFEVAYGAAGLATPAQLERFRWATFGGSIVRAAAPRTPLHVTFRDLSAAQASEECAGCVRIYLRPDLALTSSSP